MRMFSEGFFVISFLKLGGNEYGGKESSLTESTAFPILDELPLSKINKKNGSISKILDD